MDESQGPRRTVLVIEDDESITHLLRLYLENDGFRVAAAADGRAGVAAHEREQPALVILDLRLPEVDGWEVFRRIRAASQTPVLMLTASELEDDLVRGLEMGAEDYVRKPFRPRELLSRVRAVLRRRAAAGGDVPTADSPETLTFDGLAITPAARRVEVGGRRVELTAKEFHLLLLFAQCPARVFSREELLSRVWGFNFLGDSRTVDVHVGTLRKKIEADPARPRLIKTIWRVGYVFDPDGTAAQAKGERDDGD